MCVCVCAHTCSQGFDTAIEAPWLPWCWPPYMAIGVKEQREWAAEGSACVHTHRKHVEDLSPWRFAEHDPEVSNKTHKKTPDNTRTPQSPKINTHQPVSHLGGRSPQRLLSHMDGDLWSGSDVGRPAHCAETKAAILWSLLARSRLSEPLLCGARGNSCWRSPRKVKLTFTPLQWSKARGQMQIKRRRTDKSFRRYLMNVLVNAQLCGVGGGGGGLGGRGCRKS